MLPSSINQIAIPRASILSNTHCGQLVFIFGREPGNPNALLTNLHAGLLAYPFFAIVVMFKLNNDAFHSQYSLCAMLCTTDNLYLPILWDAKCPSPRNDPNTNCS